MQPIVKNDNKVCNGSAIVASALYPYDRQGTSQSAASALPPASVYRLLAPNDNLPLAVVVVVVAVLRQAVP